MPSSEVDWWEQKSYDQKYYYCYNKLKREVYVDFQKHEEGIVRKKRLWPDQWTGLSLAHR